MKISLICSTYNSSRKIERMMRSVNSQTVPFDEIVIVDDGSDDGTAKIARRGLPQAKIVRHERNRGLYAGLMTAVENSTGDYIVKMDDDDELTPRFVEECHRVLDEFPYDYVSFRQFRKDMKGNNIDTPKSFVENPCKMRECDGLKVFFLKAVPWYIIGKCVKSEIWKRSMDGSIPDNIVLDDVFISMRLHALSKSYCVPDTTEGYVYWFGVGYWSGAKNTIDIDWFRRVVEMRRLQYEKNFNFIVENGFDRRWCNELYRRCDIESLWNDIPKIPSKDMVTALKLLHKNFMLFPRMGTQ